MSNQHRKEQNESENLSDLIAYVTGEITPDKAKEVENQLNEDPNYLSQLSALIKDENHELSAAEEAEFQSIYKAPRNKHRNEFIRAVLQNSDTAVPASRNFLNFISFGFPAKALAYAVVVLIILIPILLNYLPDREKFSQIYFHDQAQKSDIFHSLRAEGTADKSSINLRSPNPVAISKINLLKTQFEWGLSEYIAGNYLKADSSMQRLIENPRYKNDLDATVAGQRLLSDIYFLHALARLNQAIDRQEKGDNYQQSIATAIDALKISLQYAEANPYLDTGRECYFIGLAYEIMGDHSTAARYLSRISPENRFNQKAGELLAR